MLPWSTIDYHLDHGDNASLPSFCTEFALQHCSRYVWVYFQFGVLPVLLLSRDSDIVSFPPVCLGQLSPGVGGTEISPKNNSVKRKYIFIHLQKNVKLQQRSELK